MGKFTKGSVRPAGAGIQKGQKQTRRIIRQRVHDILFAANRHPADEVIKILDKGDMKDAERAKLWLELLAYVEPKLSAQSITVDDAREDKDETIDVTPVSTEDLIKKAQEG